MQREPFLLSSWHGCVASLKACAKSKDLKGGLKLHSHVVELGLFETNPFVGSTLLDMYGKCGALARAEQVFKKLPVQDVVSWTALIAQYVDQGQCDKALKCFEKMQVEGVFPNAFTFACALRACDNLGTGREMHAEVERQELFKRDPIVGNSLIDMYAKLGALATAREVFDKLPMQSVVSWTSLISGYVEHGNCDEAMKCFEKMQKGSIFPSPVTYVCCLKACSRIGAIDKGRDIHVEIERQGLLEKDLFVGSTLVDMYARCDLLAIAQEVFDKLHVRNVVSWNALIAGYAAFGDSLEALKCFEQIQVEGIFPNVITLVCSLKACRGLRTTLKGKELHTKLETLGFSERDLVVGNALVDMYAKCGSLAIARQVFDMLLARDVVSWTALLAGYVEHGCNEEAIECFEQMRLEGVYPDAVSLACSLKACANIGATDTGKTIHIEIDRQGLLKGDLFVGNALVEMYAKCGLLVTGQQVFDKLPVRDDVSWNAMIAGYAAHGLGKEALKCFERVHLEGISPNSAMFVWGMKACGSIGATDKGEELHAEIESLGLLGRDAVVSNTLLCMYVKGASLARAEQVFEKLLVRDVVSWTTLMVGYSQLGESKNVFLMFERMLSEGAKPDSITFVVILSACARFGVFNKSQMYFDTMTREYGIVPNIKHHGCVVNLFGRAGQLDKAVATVKNSPHYYNMVVWGTVLGACRNWGCVDLGEQAFESSMYLDGNNSVAYVSIHADAYLQQRAGSGRE